MLLTYGTCALLRGSRCDTWSCTYSVMAFMFLMVVWHLFGFGTTVAEEGWPKALRDYWPIVVLVGGALLVVLTHDLGIW
ncbi:hypothetical protein BJI69_15130 [Luteibacter rhizovicinus DSM 16549]|uniref:Uncharacterized protein n=1 Tax=Luteibacter rhizovicinus DSM 16549 TaxID=1440763 RepID=A0A0G9HCR6_9GAMM|nr:hypothetical protein BJI69_15130 [Luteibacter rhizovicinus DSM 16549]KLD67535.1 hypothetical protein Y883_07635 [Luteibacter rhizovicinus DSM 16549]KLD76958.1 hypothetical protein Y886_18335 [Xanthomonas hyacinthi DSM 19077]